MLLLGEKRLILTCSMGKRPGKSSVAKYVKIKLWLSQCKQNWRAACPQQVGIQFFFLVL